MTAAECIEEIERLLLAEGKHPGAGIKTTAGMIGPSWSRSRTGEEYVRVVRGVEKLIECWRVFGDRS